MMDLYAVMTEIDTRLKTITGLRVAEFGYAGSVQPPAVVQYPPDRVNYDGTYGRGQDDYEDHIVVVFVGTGNRRNALKAIAPYLAGSGSKSIKAKIDSGPGGAYASCADLTVQWAELDAGARMGGTELLAALFHCKITGVGA
jgi:hypothetical protein